MKLLIDSHILLWAAVDDVRLRGPLRTAFADPTNSLLVSVATLWELSIKYSLGKLPLPVAPSDFFAREIATRGYSVVPIGRAHAERLALLPYPHSGHRDLFDRMLVSQALVEGLVLLSGDGRLGDYAAFGLQLFDHTGPG